MLLAITAAFFVLGIVTQNSLEASAQELLQEAREVEGRVAAGDWEAARAGVSRLNHTWQRVQRSWDLHIDHREMDSLETSLARLNELVQARQAGLARSELAAVTLLIRHLPEKERFSLANIL